MMRVPHLAVDECACAARLIAAVSERLLKTSRIKREYKNWPTTARPEQEKPARQARADGRASRGRRVIPDVLAQKVRAARPGRKARLARKASAAKPGRRASLESQVRAVRLDRRANQARPAKRVRAANRDRPARCRRSSR
jgi:hypothetical protein